MSTGYTTFPDQYKGTSQVGPGCKTGCTTVFSQGIKWNKEIENTIIKSDENGTVGATGFTGRYYCCDKKHSYSMFNYQGYTYLLCEEHRLAIKKKIVKYRKFAFLSAFMTMILPFMFK